MVPNALIFIITSEAIDKHRNPSHVTDKSMIEKGGNGSFYQVCSVETWFAE